MQSTATLFEFFANPIVRVSQMLALYELDDESSNEYWSSEVPVLVFTVEGNNGERSIAIAGRVYDLLWRELDESDDIVLQVERFISEELSRDQTYVAIASLDVAINPVPGWSDLKPTSVTIVDKDASLLGFCLSLNLGTRLGVFVAPNPGVTLMFNEQCDIVLEQAKAHHEMGRLRVQAQVFDGNETSKQFDEIDWFDWLTAGKAT
jgi:hypothetical protein